MKLRILLSIFVTLFAGRAAASEFVVCEFCSNYNQFEMRAMTAVGDYGGTAKVFNPWTGQIMTFKAVAEREPGSPVIYNTSQIPTTNEDLKFAQSAAAAYSRVHDFFDANRQVPSSIVSKGYDLVGHSSLLVDVTNYYNSSQTLGSAWSDYTSAIVGMAGKLIGVTAVVDLSFSDGSIATMAISGINADGDLQFTIFKLIDKDGNIIPLNKDQFNQRSNDTFTFTSADRLNDFLNLAARFGITVIRVSGGTPTGTTQITDCDADGCFVKKPN
ncbi:hypothetical protein PVT67_16195 [Gallaecimonas kandeliae]|uniref:hypothetical protein n=1 Tax=Gallaecimonas kandeliae TaxID=3029055 RepID=UPI00264A2715|nr:hypothetical protein [Gallaecimonas kandeliae]WKE65184.1 hypothetical protein PVT67_16195 [Gallaecimonas kandeliae]